MSQLSENRLIKLPSIASRYKVPPEPLDEVKPHETENLNEQIQVIQMAILENKKEDSKDAEEIKSING